MQASHTFLFHIATAQSNRHRKHAVHVIDVMKSNEQSVGKSVLLCTWQMYICFSTFRSLFHRTILIFSSIFFLPGWLKISIKKNSNWNHFNEMRTAKIRLGNMLCLLRKYGVFAFGQGLQAYFSSLSPFLQSSRLDNWHVWVHPWF